VVRKPTDIVHLKLRFPEALRRRLEHEAASNGRSMNAEIIHRVEETFRQADLRRETRHAAKLAAQLATTGMVDKLRVAGALPDPKPREKPSSEGDQS
jgi:hypothetical protein